jgi:hypothetical protein
MVSLPHLLEVPGGISPGDLRFSPTWDPLRKDPRFEALLKIRRPFGTKNARAQERWLEQPADYVMVVGRPPPFSPKKINVG